MADRWLVTGACSGIGRAVVDAAVAAGESVLALDVNDQVGQTLAQQPGVRFEHLDVSDREAWLSLAASLSADAVPNRVHLNAGIQSAPPDAPLAEYTLEAATLENYRRMMGVNVDGVVFGLQALLPKLTDGTSIVVTGSLAGVVPYAVDPLYSLSKHAVTGLVRSMGEPLAARGIRINALCPGGIDTAIIPLEQRVPAAVFMTPQHVAEEVRSLMEKSETGKTWAKVAQSKPIFVIRAPGDRSA